MGRLTRGLCEECGVNVQQSSGRNKEGLQTYKKRCSSCHKRRFGISTHKYRTPYKKFKKGYCEDCGFIPVHSCQLDVDHVNGDHDDNSEGNLRTLCANCHRLKTYINKDWE